MEKEYEKYQKSEVKYKEMIAQGIVINHYLTTLSEEEHEKIFKEVNETLSELEGLDSEIENMIKELN